MYLITIYYGSFENYGSSEHPEVLFTAYDKDHKKVIINTELLPKELLTEDQSVRMPFHCYTSCRKRNDKWERIADRCFSNYEDAFEYANMIIEGLEYELHELTGIVQQNKSLN
jgi:hypothetical protein